MIDLKQTLIRAAAILIAAALCMIPVCADAPSVSAQHAILMDADTGAVLYEKDADAQSLIASTTKIMTGLLVCETCDLDEQVIIPPEAVGIEGSSVYLKAGETLTVRDLLYGMLLQSGNDAATALALHLSGSIEAFADRMNDKARELGLTNTHFANPHGLDDEENYGSARDLATLTSYALKNPDFAQAASTKTYRTGDRCFVNHNKLLWNCEGAIGVKTGFTKKAGRILVSAAERNGRTLICVTVSAPDDWNDHCALYDYGFSQYEMTAIAQAGESVGTLPLIAEQTVSFPLLANETVIYEFHPDRLFPYLTGTVIAYLGNNEIARIPAKCFVSS